MTAKYDYPALELEYIQGPDDLTPRKMAERDGAPFSAYYDQYRKHEWARKRAEYRAEQQTKVIAAITDATAEKVAAIKRDAFEVIHAAILKMGLDLQDRTVLDYDHSTGKQYQRVIPGQTITANDVSKLIDKLLVLTGNPNTINESRNLNADLTPQLPPDVARLIAEVATERGSAAGGVGRATLPGARPARTN